MNELLIFLTISLFLVAIEAEIHKRRARTKQLKIQQLENHYSTLLKQ